MRTVATSIPIGDKQRRGKLLNGEVQRMTKQPTVADGFLKPRDVAVRLKISMRTLQRWLHQGLLPAEYRFGNSVVRWHARDIEQYIQECRLVGQRHAETQQNGLSPQAGQGQRNKRKSRQG
jgi:excisionase family DNA binding protein